MIGRLKSYWNSLAARDRRSLIICMVFLGVTGLYLGIIEPIYLGFDNLHKQKQALEDTIKSHRNAALSVVRRRAKLEDVRNESEYLVKKLNIEDSGASTLSELFYNLKLYASQAGVTIEQAAPLDVVARENYEEVPFTVQARGSFKAISKFIYFIETSPMVLVISDIQIRGGDDNRDDGVTVRLQASKIGLETVDEEIADSYLNVLHIGLEQWIGFAPFYVAKEHGWLTDQDVNIKLVHGIDTTELSHLMRSADIDGLCMSLSDHVAAMEEGFEFKGIYPLAWSNGDAAIVVSKHSPATSLHDLDEVDIYGAGREAQFVVYKAFTKNNIPFLPEQVHDLSSPLVMQSLSTGLIKAGVLWEPSLSLFKQEQSGKIVYISDKLSTDSLATLVLRDDVLENKSQAAAFLIQALKKATQWMADHPEETRQIIAEYMHMSDTSVQQGLASLHFPTPGEQKALVGCDDGTENLAPFIRQQEQFLETFYQKKVSLPTQDFFDWRLIRPFIGCTQTRESDPSDITDKGNQ